jgi:hypothetical protein
MSINNENKDRSWFDVWVGKGLDFVSTGERRIDISEKRTSIVLIGIRLGEEVDDDFLVDDGLVGEERADKKRVKEDLAGENGVEDGLTGETSIEKAGKRR